MPCPHCSHVSGYFLHRYADGSLREQTAAEATDRPLIELPYDSADVLRRIGVYDIVGELGRGGMGVVYKAYSIKLSCYVALKLIQDEGFFGLSSREVIRFHNEARFAARLRHPHIVSVIDSGDLGDVHYIAMSYIDGQPLQDLLAKRGKCELNSLVRMQVKVARALHYAHQSGVIHRDIKPSNLLVDSQGEPLIADFGLAKELSSQPGLTCSGAVLGTPNYMPPEQANGELQHIGPRSDIYSMGATLYHVLTGRPPFIGANLMEVLAQVIEAEPEPPSRVARRELGIEISRDLETICLKAMEKEAVRRYQTADELADELERYLNGQPILARPYGLVERLAKLLRRRRGLLIGSFILLTKLLVLGATFVTLSILVVNRSNEALRQRETIAANQQAETLQRAIRVNMLQGRADLARELVQRLSADPLSLDPQAARIQVVRVDRSIAYTDQKTRRAVERRLADPKVLAFASKNFPQLTSKIDVLRRIGFPEIDRSKQTQYRYAQVNEKAWKKALLTLQPQSYSEYQNGVRQLVILRPIRNDPECQVCHGLADASTQAGYDFDSNRVRAVLMVRRSQEEVDLLVASNRRTILRIGLAAIGVIWLLLLLFYKLFGLELPARRFGTPDADWAERSTDVMPPPGS